MKVVRFEWFAERWSAADGGEDTGVLAIRLDDGRVVRPRFVIMQTVAMLLNGIGSILPIANMLVRNGTVDRLHRPLKNWGPCHNSTHSDECTCLHDESAGAGEAGEAKTA